MPRGLVFINGSERLLLSHPDSPSSQIALEIRIRGGCSSMYSPVRTDLRLHPQMVQIIWEGRSAGSALAYDWPSAKLHKKMPHVSSA